MRQYRLRFYSRAFARADALFDNVLIPVLAVTVLLGFLWNVTGGVA